ncbi:hypothetical protein [Virgisporangium ochraceum]|uniref:hypothetical protein n=1 Tax=Virgisporangium ochraceum TaxID=65505 RepID=UPI001941C026|nr:hypothetical protein [Virgisporangium ochraceum]
MVLQPDERGRQAAAGQGLRDGGGGRELVGQPVQAGPGERVEVGGGHPVGAVDVEGRREQQGVGEVGGMVKEGGHRASPY